MKILVVGIVNNPQITRLKEEAEKKGHTLDACYVTEIAILCRGSDFEPTLRGKSLSSYDLVYLMTLGKRRWVWYAACDFLKKKGVVIVNNSVVDNSFNFNPNVAKEYLIESENSIPYPKTLVVLSSKSLDSVCKHFEFPLVIKSGEGRQGKSVYKVTDQNELFRITKKLEDEKSTAVVREFIPNDGDIRIFTVGYKAIGAMRRIPKKGEFRSNISQGGKGEKYDLESYPNIKQLAEKAADACRIEIAGVDIIIDNETRRPYVLEVNPGPQFLGLEKYTGVNAAGEIIKYFESLLSVRNIG